MNHNSGSSIEELQKQLAALRAYFTVTLAVLVLLSFALNIFIFRQASMASKQVEENQKFVDDYNKVSAPLITDFLTKLNVFSKTNPEIARLLVKYNVQQALTKTGATVTPGTAPVAAPKK